MSNTKNKHFTRDDTKNIVIDNKRGLMWQDDEDSSTKHLTFEEAIIYAQNLNLHGISGWRLPTIEELVSISDTKVQTIFRYTIENSYWSSTITESKKSYSWPVYVFYGDNYVFNKKPCNYVRCVRDKEHI